MRISNKKNGQYMSKKQAVWNIVVVACVVATICLALASLIVAIVFAHVVEAILSAVAVLTTELVLLNEIN